MRAASLWAKIGQRCPNRSRMCREEHLYRYGPFVFVIFGVDRCETRDPRIVDQVVDSPEPLRRCVSHLLYAVRVGDIHRPTSRGTPGIGDLSNHGIHFGLTEICNCHVGAFISEKVRCLRRPCPPPAPVTNTTRPSTDLLSSVKRPTLAS